MDKEDMVCPSCLYCSAVGEQLICILYPEHRPVDATHFCGSGEFWLFDESTEEVLGFQWGGWAHPEADFIGG